MGKALLGTPVGGVFAPSGKNYMLLGSPRDFIEVVLGNGLFLNSIFQFSKRAAKRKGVIE